MKVVMTQKKKKITKARITPGTKGKAYTTARKALRSLKIAFLAADTKNKDEIVILLPPDLARQAINENPLFDGFVGDNTPAVEFQEVQQK